MSVQNNSGFVCIISGPGCIPVIANAPSINAITAFSGIPSINKGIKFTLSNNK